MTLTDKIRTLRIMKGYSQEYMANELEISQNAYSKLEAGKTQISVKRVYEIALVLGISIYELLPETQR